MSDYQVLCPDCAGREDLRRYPEAGGRSGAGDDPAAEAVLSGLSTFISDGWSSDGFAFLFEDEDGTVVWQEAEEIVTEMEAPCDAMDSQEPHQPGYSTAVSTPPDLLQDPDSEDAAADMGERSREVHPPRPWTYVSLENLLDYDQYVAANAHKVVLFRSLLIILFAFLLMKNVITILGSEEDEYHYVALSQFTIQVMGFLVPCYALAWLLVWLHRRWTRNEMEGLATEEIVLRQQAAAQHGEGQHNVLPSQAEEPLIDPN